MKARGKRSIWRDESAAVAPTIALALVGLIGVGGLAFDYARLATMDTELQNAADQAALAAATQLNGATGSRAAATSAAQSLISNVTRFSNDGLGSAATVSTVTFYADEAKTTVSLGDSDANFVEVAMTTRRANYALTPIVGALGGSLDARAFAGIGGAVCGVVPFFICNPTEPSDNVDVNYSVSVPSGIGVQMLEGGDQKGPGNFGFLAYLGVGANTLEKALSTDVLYDECTSATSALTEPGQKTSVFDGLNRRFDLDVSCKQAPCSTSTNERKDLVREAGSCNWKENPTTLASLSTNSPGRYRPATNAPLAASVTPEIMGHPRDICHSVGKTSVCSGGQIGDGVWDRAAYFRSNHPGLDWAADVDLGPSVTRYKTYLWEAEDAAGRLESKPSSTSGWAAYGTPQAGVCNPPGISPISGAVDRRRMTAAVVNCRAYGRINGRPTLPVAGFIDVFLVEPSIKREKCDGNGECKTAYTDNTDIYVEVIGAAGTGEGGANAQITRRNVPRLIE